MKRTERKTKIPGIYKRYIFDEKIGDWRDTGQYRAIRSVVAEDGFSKSEKRVCHTLKEAKEFRFNKIVSDTVHENIQKEEKSEAYTMADLIEDWKKVNFSQVELATKETYIKTLRFFNDLVFYKDKNKMCEVKFNFLAEEVASFNVEKIDQLILTLMSADFPKSARRYSFKKELKLLDQLFKFYQTRKKPMFPSPVLSLHMRKSVVRKKDKSANKENYLKAEDMPKFFSKLKEHNNKNYYYLALSQFFLGLRIGEASGLHWQDFDEVNMKWKIEKVITWCGSQSGAIKELPKNDTIRYQPFSNHYLEEMRFFKKLTGNSRGLVFRRKSNRPLRRNSIVRAYNKALKDCGITYVSGSHMMRKTSATLGHGVTKDTLAVSGFLGHSNIKITDAYLGRSDVKKSHADALEEVFQGSLSVEGVEEKLRLIR